jgi:hypothetical protein
VSTVPGAASEQKLLQWHALFVRYPCPTHNKWLALIGHPLLQEIEKTQGKELDSDSTSSGADDTAHAGHVHKV